MNPSPSENRIWCPAACYEVAVQEFLMGDFLGTALNNCKMQDKDL